MSKDSDALLIEMFDGVDLTATVPEIPDIEMSKLMERVDNAPAGAANGLVRKLMYLDLLERVLGEVPAPAPASLPTEVGVVPSAGPNTGTASGTKPKDSARRQKLRQLLIDAGISMNAYNEETISSLLVSMDAYISDSIKISRRVG
jgi:hypothetical protein